MRRRTLVLVAAVVSFSRLHAAGAQPSGTRAVRPAPLDPAAIRGKAARLAELRALLADPDPNVRQLTMREMARSGDPDQRAVAVDVGLASAETAMQEIALLVLMAGTEQIVITLADTGGPAGAEAPTSFVLTVASFEPDSGKLTGRTWSGQIQGAVFSFAVRGGAAGRLVWDPENAEFRGTVAGTARNAKGDRAAVWRPR